MATICVIKGLYLRIAACILVTQHVFSTPQCLHIYDENGRNMSIGDLFRGKDKENWLKSMSMELGRFVQGNKYGVKSTDTIGFFNQSEVPSIAKVTYANFVAGF